MNVRYIHLQKKKNRNKFKFSCINLTVFLFSYLFQVTAITAVRALNKRSCFILHSTLLLLSLCLSVFLLYFYFMFYAALLQK